MKKKNRSRVRHAPPSKASLREMPEADFSKGKWRRNPARAERIRKEGLVVQPDGEAPIVLRKPGQVGRPRLGEEVAPSKVVSFRLPVEICDRAKARAKKERTTMGDIVRTVLAEHL